MNIQFSEILSTLESQVNGLQISKETWDSFIEFNKIQNMDEFNKFLTIGLALRNVDLKSSDFIFSKLSELNVGHGQLFSEMCINSFVKNNINTIKENPSALISARYLGAWGRFGNQLIQFMLLICLGHKLNCAINYPTWIGNYLFNIETCPETHFLNTVDKLTLNRIFTEKLLISNFDIGTSLVKLSALMQFRDYLISKLRFKSKLNLLNELKNMGFKPESALAIHIRLSDFKNRNTESKVNLLVDWLEKNVNDLPIDNIWILSDDRNCLDAFEKFGAKSPMKKDKNIQDLDFLYDWQLIQNSKYCLINEESTFSTTAAFLSNLDQVIFSQNINNQIVNFNWSCTEDMIY